MIEAIRPPDQAICGVTRHRHELIRDLGLLLRTRMSRSGHLLQAVTQESRGNCLPPSRGCWDGCVEAQRLVALTEPFMPKAARAARPVKPLRSVVLKRPRRAEAPRTLDLFDVLAAEGVAG